MKSLQGPPINQLNNLMSIIPRILLPDPFNMPRRRPGQHINPLMPNNTNAACDLFHPDFTEETMRARRKGPL
ncbi:hypothetical protein BDV40DRAFT_270670 [Aspergillus tamarii]|uniref:Uncharacterized protein n=1 Tax=Aspergillus tamarii TaxID=41984 RepID=A0A5N6UP26_ASPTM|nr:hypothetical protein BDV40DRAFT_270670 [Aspergillus tamarii]